MAKQNKGRKFFAASATAALVASAIVPVASAAQFNDENKISGYAKEAVKSLVDTGVIKGDEKGNFNPTNPVTRAEAAKIFAEALELQAEGDVNFTDVKKGTWYYNSIAAVVANGIFEGMTAKEFAPNGKLTRAQAAKIMVEAFGLEGSESLSQFADASTVQPWAKSYLETAVANGIFTGSEVNGKLNLNPNSSITRQDFAVVFARTLDLIDTETPAEAASVKAINNTTVEVTFDSEIDDIKSLKFAIDGLEVKNAVVKQTNGKVAVLTTESQKEGTEYTVTVDGEKVGSFKGIAAVIPTEIKVETTSLQSKVGQEVTLKATTAPGAQVTFNVQATGNSLNENKKVEVTADDKGVATYSYTQYGVAGVDNVTVYPTGAPSLLGYAKVYWGQDIILSVDSEAKTVDNGGNRLYTVTYKDATTGQPVSGKTLNVTFKENLNDIDGSKTNDTTASIRKNNGQYITPYQDSAASAGSNREEAFQIVTNSVGQATFTVTGKNTTATPVVFEDADKNSRFGATELQATAGESKFQGVQSPYTISFDKTADFVAALSGEHGGQQNPIAYKLKVVTDKKDKDGNAIPYVGATIKVAIQQNQDNTLSNNTPAQIAGTENGTYNSDHVVSVTTDSKGEATVYLKSAVDNTKATPVAWIDLNSAGNNAGTVGNNKLEDGEPNAVAPTVTFLKSVVVAPGYSLNTPKAGAYVTGDRMTWKSSLENQSGNVSETAGIKNATYTITNTSNKQLTFNPRLVDNAGKNYTDLTVTYNDGTQTRAFTNGSAVTLEPGTTVTIHGVGSDFKAATSTVAEYSTTNDALLHIEAPNVDGSLSVSAHVTTVRKAANGDSRNDNNTYTYDAKSADFLKAVVVPNAPATGAHTVTGEVIGFEIADKTTAQAIGFVSTNKFNLAGDNNYGRVVIKERHTGIVKVFNYDSADSFSAALDGNFNAQTDNLLATDSTSPAASKFESLLTVGDEIQVNATAVGQVGTVRLFNKDASTGGSTSGNGVAAVVSARSLDNDGNGTIERVRIQLNQPVNAGYVYGAGDFTLPTGFTVTGANVVTPATGVIDVMVTAPANHGTAPINGDVTLTAQAANKLSSLFGGKSFTANIVDGAAPVILRAVSSDTDADGNWNRVEFTFSETITNTSAIDAGDFRFGTAVVDFNTLGLPALGGVNSGTSISWSTNANNQPVATVDFAVVNAAPTGAPLRYAYAPNFAVTAGSQTVAAQDAAANNAVATSTVSPNLGALTTVANPVVGTITVNNGGNPVVAYAPATPNAGSQVITAPAVTTGGTLNITVNGGIVVAVPLLPTDNTVASIVTKINNAANLAGISTPIATATNAGADIKITSTTTGVGSSIAAAGDATLAGTIVTGIQPAVAGTAGVATPAVYSFTITQQLVAGQQVTVTLDGTTKTYTAVSGAPANGNEIQIGISTTATAANLAAAINAVYPQYNVANTGNTVTFTQNPATPAVHVLSVTLN